MEGERREGEGEEKEERGKEGKGEGEGGGRKEGGRLRHGFWGDGRPCKTLKCASRSRRVSRLPSSHPWI